MHIIYTWILENIIQEAASPTSDDHLIKTAVFNKNTLKREGIMSCSFLYLFGHQKKLLMTNLCCVVPIVMFS